VISNDRPYRDSGKSREIPVRHDLQEMLDAYILTLPHHPPHPFSIRMPAAEINVPREHLDATHQNSTFPAQSCKIQSEIEI
jgi:hypothetical protein